MKKIGLLVPCTNLTVEYELEHLYNINYFNYNEVVFYIAKLQYKTNYKQNKLKFLEDISNDEKNKVAELQYLKVDYMASFCTSASVVSKKMINNPFDAILKVARQKNIRKCYFITPYSDDIGNKLADKLEENDISVTKSVNLNLLHTQEYFEFGMQKLKKVILEDYKKDYGDIIISCTNIPTIHFLRELKDELKCEAISSNSCMFEIIHGLLD